MKTVPVSRRALIQRINRKLKPDLKWLKITRGAAAERDFGRYYVLDYNHNRVVEHHVDVAELAAELKCLSAWERADDAW